MLHPDEREKLERGFVEGEASLFLSGMKPSEFAYSVKALILAGEINLEQGQDEIFAHHRNRKVNTAVA
jgi:hypothetical protein